MKRSFDIGEDKNGQKPLLVLENQLIKQTLEMQQ
jgi:hypothetical protein